MRIDELKRTLPPCCEISTAPVGIYPHEAREMVVQFMPDVKTIKNLDKKAKMVLRRIESTNLRERRR